MNEFIYLLPIGIALFLAFNMGASGTAPSFSAAYGARLIRKELIPGLFGIFVIGGALLAGRKVLATIGGEILPAGQMNLVSVSVVLLASALSLFFANILKVPQSTSQSTVFALAGCAIYLGDFNTRMLFFEIIPAWFILPIVAFAVTLLLGFLGGKSGSPVNASGSRLDPGHRKWRLITLACSCYVAFSIGANNVANAAGPVASMLRNELGLSGDASSFILVSICILLVAPWFGIGGSILGRRVLSTTGKDMINIGPREATLVSIITATLLLLASTLRGIPTSLVQMNTFSLMALGCLRKGGSDGLRKAVVFKLWITWLTAPAIAFLLAYALTGLTQRLGW